ncbi:MAG TPA: amino acid adenylation domain-containing protein [Pyrinomonadaceae bacterium]|jgi:amino acid adenylation domain-containing protein/non-ribosomal peptide synthase protein (TIGR01720 family)|nr:amino acid adenylation domain-containing protein [Pyrinomonadaceae bacterium]
MTTGVNHPPVAVAKPRTLAGLLRARAQGEPGRVAYRFLSDGEAQGESVTYAELDGRARSVAAVLQSTCDEGERALLLYPPGLDYVAAFFGCLYAGVVAVPAYPPHANRRQRLESIAADSQAALALTTERIFERVSSRPEQKDGFGQLTWLATDRFAPDSDGRWREPASPDEEGLAYLQYTSGSTSAPKGVMVTHANVLHNSAYIHQGFGHTPESVSLCWLPHFHDMGLLDGIIQPLYGGFPGLLMSPAAFLQRPLGWLKAISQHRVTHSGGPNFAYDLCVRRVGPEQRAGLDLGSWRVAYNGAEPVRAETLRRFAEAFAPCGFRRESFYPAYGLAEATLKVSGGVRGSEPVIFTARAVALEENRVEEAAGGGEDARPLVGCGRASMSTEVRIVRPETLDECAPDEVGEIWVGGPGVAAGYWRRPEETERTFRAYLPETGEGPFLRTGDLGFVRGGELFVTGRLKDLIIIRGRNHYPQDIEAAVERAHPSLRPSAGAAFSVEVDGEERLVIAQEVETRRPADWRSVVESIREAVTEEFEIQPASVVLLKPGAVPKTSSGKIRRADSRAMFLRREWEAVAEWSAPRGEEAEPDAPLTFSSAASVENWLREKLEARLGLPAGGLDVNRPLARYGVDSLLAVELMHDLETRAGVSLPPADFLQSPSLAELAERAARQASAPAPPRLKLETNGAEGGWHPLSHNQKSLWFMHHVAPDSAAYNVSFAARIRGRLQTDALGRAFQALVNRHPSLRTSFESIDGEPAQRVHERAPVFFKTEDARLADESRLRERMSLEARHRFDLADAPLLRVFLFGRADDEHVMLLVAHHLVVDFWSLSVLMRELGELYDAEVEGRPAALEPPASRYADYVSWQREWLESAEGERQRRFWLERLSGEPPALDLPTDHPRPAVQGYRGAALPLRLGATLTGNLKALARSNDATLYTLLLAAFEVLLYRHTGQRDLLVGSPFAGRGSARLSNVVGYFVNPVVLRAKLSPEMSFEQLLARARRDTLDAFSHQDYPFELLVKQLQPVRDASRAPLFQAMFALQRARRPEEQALAAFALGEAGAEVNVCGLRLESVALDQRAAQFDLSLTAAEVGEELAASFEYSTELFEAPTIERMAGHFRVLLEAIAAEPSRPLADLPLLTDAERGRLLHEWNDVRPAPGAGALVHELFERQAAQRPEQTAVVGAAGRLSYGELNSKAERLARHLRARGVGPNVVVALCAERSPEMLVGVLAVLKAGGAYVPLDPSYPPARLRFMLEDTAAPFLLTQRKFTEAFQSSPAEIVLLEEDLPPVSPEGDERPRVEVGADSLAYVIYTSGSTGKPKGVMISHGALSHYIATVTDEYRITPADRMLQFASLSFDISVEEIFSSLTRGATLVLRDEETTASPVSLLRLCREQRVTILNLPTAYWHQLAAVLTPADWDLAESVRLVVTGSEKLQPERLSQWHAAVGGRARLVDVYGPTEATVGSTICDLDGVTGAADSARKISIGRPFRHAQAYILDSRLQPVPVGVAGELHVGGHALSQGYLRRPALTAAAFIPHPFGATPGARLYKTGDLARFLHDGNIEFLGRLDSQVKVRGFRIEPGEIERALVRHERVREAAVVVRSGDGENRLVAYVVADSPEPPATKDLRQHLKESLPAYMLPSAFVFLDALPLTPGGKVDRRALPAPERSAAEPAPDFVAPRTELERTLAGIWADALRLERVGLHDNFFELGGDSILIIQIVARAHQAGINLSATQMFQSPTVAELAAAASPTASAPDDEAAAVGEAPLTPIQRWFFEQEFEAADHWNMALLLEAKAPVRAGLLERALSILVARHDSLRLRFAREGGGWRQFVAEASEASFALRRVDLSAAPEAEQAAAVEAVAAETQARLSLSEGRMLSAALFELGEGRAPRLLLVAHHLAVDGVSWGILLEDLAGAYEQLRRGEGVELPPKTTSFKTWAERLDEHARSDSARRGAEYWTRLAAKEFKSLPVDRPGGGAALEDSTRVVSVSLSEEETRALLHDAPPVYHTQVNDVLLTALLAAFSRRTGDGALLVDLEGHGREELFAGVNLSRTVGWFTNVFPVLLRLDEPFAPGPALKSVKEQLRAVPGHGMGYGVLRYSEGAQDLKAALASAPPAQVSFNYLGRVDRMLESAAGWTLAGEGVGGTRGGRNRRTHLLEVNAGVYDGALRLDWSYSRDLHDRATVERLAADYLETLRAVVAHCLSPGAGGHTPSDFPLAGLDQRRLDELLRDAGGVADIYPLSPMQQGMLFHSLYAPAAGMYVEQLSCVLKGGLDVAAFEGAWRDAATRHAVLRTAFVWENLNEPLQVVRQSVSLPIDQCDWRGLPRAEQERLLEAYLSEDRLRPFDPSRAPLMRLALARTDEDAYHFVWTHHHLLLDGWSAASLLREVLAGYESLRRGEATPARRPPPFRHYIAWSRQQDASKAERFWRDELKGFAKPTLLTAGRHAGGAAADEPPQVSKQEARLTPDETAALHAFARSSQLTLGTLVHGAFALLLGCYSGEDDVVFGTTVSGRPPALAGVDEMVGLFINTLPVRVRVEPRASVLSWLRGLQGKLAGLRDYEYGSLAEIQGWSDVPRGQALFECLLAFENYPVDAALLDGSGGLKLEDVRSSERTNYPLTVAALPGDGLRLQALYTNDRFDDATAGRLLAHLKRLLLDIAAGEDKSLADVRLLDDDERRRILADWNETATAYPREQTVRQLFEAWAERTPEAPAVVCGEERLTYAELNARANRLARRLREKGVGPEATVGVLMERSAGMVVALLGVLKAGGAYLPLDPAHPRERLSYMLGDAGARVLLTTARLAQDWPDDSAVHVLRLDADARLLTDGGAENPRDETSADSLAYVIYTSGSTGRPKGVSVTHRNVVRLVCGTDYLHVRATDRVAHLSNVAFDAATFEMWGALLNGACLVIIDRQVALSQHELLNEVRRQRVSVLLMTTALFNEMARQMPDAFAGIGCVMTGGETAEPRWFKEVLDCGAPGRLLNVYGPTENCTFSTWHEVKAVADDARQIPIGRPVANSQAYVLDRLLRPVPVGVVGELCVGGDGLARGYHGRPGLTAERFVPNPYGREAGARLYKTGDLARLLPDGTIEFLGRLDHQVKVRGYRIELGEIEAVLAAHEAVGGAVVVAREDARGERRLAAYVVAADGRERGEVVGELRAYLRGRLPEYMVPSAFVLLESLPLTPNGKVDRRALPAPDSAGAQAGAEFVAPRNPLEEALADIWRGVLGVERVGVHDNFFELGGHSLMATRVLSNVRRIFRIDLPLRVLFDSATVAELAPAVAAFEAEPGQVEKIARVLQKLKSIPAGEARQELQKKRRERVER